MSVLTTLALFTVTPEPVTEIETASPLTVFADFNVTTSAAITLPETT